MSLDFVTGSRLAWLPILSDALPADDVLLNFVSLYSVGPWLAVFLPHFSAIDAACFRLAALRFTYSHKVPRKLRLPSPKNTFLPLAACRTFL